MNHNRMVELLDEEMREYLASEAQTRAAVGHQIRQLESHISRNNDRGMDSQDTPPQGSRPTRRRGRGARSRETENNTLLDEPIPHLESPTVVPQELEIHRQSNRRVKRRKLESDDVREGTRGFSYGQFGQVVPGALRMEIASCDGGTYEPDGESSFPDNILRNDSSVYCTKSDRCNLLLKHVGGAPFCLKRIVIKAPKTGYDSPYVFREIKRFKWNSSLTIFRIQEGMVFVSMTSDDILTRTAQDQVHYSGARRRRRNRRSGLSRYAPFYPLPYEEELERAMRGSPDSEDSTQTTVDPVAGFRVTTSHNDNDRDIPEQLNEQEDDDDCPTIEEIERLRIGQLMEDDIACTDSDDSESDSTSDLNVSTSQFDSFYRRRRRLSNLLRIPRQQQQQQQQQQRQHQTTSFVEPPMDSQTNALRSNGLLRPHAQFFIERAQSMVNIKFDPPPCVISRPTQLKSLC